MFPVPVFSPSLRPLEENYGRTPPFMRIQYADACFEETVHAGKKELGSSDVQANRINRLLVSLVKIEDLCQFSLTRQQFFQPLLVREWPIALQLVVGEFLLCPHAARLLLGSKLVQSPQCVFNTLNGADRAGQTSETMIDVAAIRLMLNRLTAV